MGSIDFPTWMDAGSYGGLICSLLVAGCLAIYALRRRRGTPRQLARAMLVCLAASALMLPEVWWDQNRLDVYGPSLAFAEVVFWLAWSALLGWCVPLGTLATYATLAAPQQQQAPTSRSTGAERAAQAAAERALADPERRVEPLGGGIPWGQLVPIETAQPSPAIPLTRQSTVLGREVDNDIMLDDMRASRHHTQIRWDHGRVHLYDLGSMNGTFVNQQAVQGPVLLKAGDVIEIGARRFRFEPAHPESQNGHAPPVEETRKMAGAPRLAVASGPRPQETLTLVALSGEVVGTEWDVRGPVAVIGRGQECDVSLPDNSVSRQHAQVVHQPEGYFLTDLQSSNGTFLNDAELSAPTRLSPGDVIRVGEVTLRFGVRASPAQQTQTLKPEQRKAVQGTLKVTSPLTLDSVAKD